MRIAVTGGSGELGRHLVPYLLAAGHDVVSIDRAPPATPHDPPARSAEHVTADVCDFETLADCLRGCQALIHLAAHRSPVGQPAPVVYGENTLGSYNVLHAAATLGIRRLCLASSINAIGGAYSGSPHYDYFPLDERHPSYAEDSYSLSKWVMEQQAAAFARQYDGLSIASLRFHWLLESHARAAQLTAALGAKAARHLWGYTLLLEADRACLLALTADFSGHEIFYIAAPRIADPEPALELARRHYPGTPVRGDLLGQVGFFDCRKAERLLCWRHAE